jgi:hypothetical protein
LNASRKSWSTEVAIFALAMAASPGRESEPRARTEIAQPRGRRRLDVAPLTVEPLVPGLFGRPTFVAQARALEAAAAASARNSGE